MSRKHFHCLYDAHDDRVELSFESSDFVALYLTILNKNEKLNNPVFSDFLKDYRPLFESIKR